MKGPRFKGVGGVKGPRVGHAVLGVALSVATIAPSEAHAAGISPPPLSQARLEGQFLLNGEVTVASNVAGEHRGQHVTRTWTFVPLCSSGPCDKVRLIRERAGHRKDALTIQRIKPALYRGSGRFYAPLKCGGRTYSKGESVPFTIDVKIKAAGTRGGTAVVSSISASYTNRSRTNRTPCFAVLGHDAAFYRGHLVSA